jgi:hypothetical protein
MFAIKRVYIYVFLSIITSAIVAIVRVLSYIKQSFNGGIKYPEINFILKSKYEDLNESYNKPNTIFLAHVRRMHWVCISNIYLNSNTRNIDKELYVVYDCFTKGSSSCSTHVDWLNGFSFLLRNYHRI